MPDLRDRFAALADDLAGLPRPAPADVRRAVARRRTSRALLAAGAVAAATVVLATAAEPAGLRVVDDPPPPTGTATTTTTTPAPARPWLPAPWTVESTTSAPYDFCGRPVPQGDRFAVAQQVLRHPDGSRARLVAFTATPSGAVDVFKWAYASCLVPGDAESVGGPRNVWSYGGAVAAVEMSGGSAYVAELSGPGVERRDAERLLDAWARTR